MNQNDYLRSAIVCTHRCLVASASRILTLAAFLVGLGIFSLTISGFNANGHSLADENQVRIFVNEDLVKVPDGIQEMKDYSLNSDFVVNNLKDEEVLAGFKGVRRNRLQRRKIQDAMETASEVGYYASEIVYDNQMSMSDYNCLLKIVEAEAQDCSLESRMGVARVVLNRVDSELFPDEIEKVVLETDQFQPVSDGRYYQVEVSGDTITAVDHVLSESETERQEKSQGALFFFTRDSSEDVNISWFDSALVPLFYTGDFEFFGLEA